MRNNRLLICMPYKQFVRKAVDAGFRVYSIWDPSLESAEYLQEVARLSEEMVLCDFSDETQLRHVVATMAARHDVAHVIHLGREATQLPVCEQAHALGLALNSPRSLVLLNDKSAMRRLLRERGISPMTTREADSPAEAQRLLRGAADLPVVVKPTQLDGSRAVRLIEQPSDVDAWIDELAACRYAGPVLVEEYLRGPEFSVETLTVHGQHHLVGITAKRLGSAPHFVEMGHVHPAPLRDEDRSAIAELVVAYLDATGYRFGPAHTEVILTAAGPRIVESQARIGGDRIPLLIELAGGFDIESAVFRALAGEPAKPRAAKRLGCVSFFDFGPGRVQALEGAEEVRRLPFVHALVLKFDRGDVLGPVSSSATRHGYVVIDAAHEREAAERLAAVQGLLRVVTTLNDGPTVANPSTITLKD